MKKTLTTTLLIALCFITIGCTKTDVENDLEKERGNQELLTQEEFDALRADGDIEFEEDYIRELDDATEERRVNDALELIDDIEGSKADKLAGKGAVGSCEAIAESSTCVEYHGSFWTKESARLNCSDTGKFSTESCPTDHAGGCNTGVGTMADMVSWMYLRGDGGITAESLKYAKMVCDATMASQWIVSK
ncbi:MAG: hypothetical protein HOE80_03435 [Candidatus Magasanikbacteria bacterium]|nr:hypothetical protein [Candidatus Magasanikbacteria bacterium]MBT4071750.1 hypothetical protein [Candidatus Magasanikbacteria bacterium]